MAYQDRFVQVDGLKTRYIEDGSGPAAICLHGASLASSADVFERNLGPLAKAGLRVIAYDQPGFGLTDHPADFSVNYRRRFILMSMEALGLQTAAMIGHSQAGNMSMANAFEHSERISKLMILFGKDDRANVFERACLLKESFPQLDLHIVDNCKHLVQWDAMDRFHELAASSLPN